MCKEWMRRILPLLVLFIFLPRTSYAEHEHKSGFKHCGPALENTFLVGLPGGLPGYEVSLQGECMFQYAFVVWRLGPGIFGSFSRENSWGAEANSSFEVALPGNYYYVGVASFLAYPFGSRQLDGGVGPLLRLAVPQPNSSRLTSVGFLVTYRDRLFGGGEEKNLEPHDQGSERRIAVSVQITW